MKHQIICTYCEKDFFTGEKGFGVASASRGFPTKYISEILERSKYVPPKIPKETELTPELCELMPESFSCFRIGKKSYALGKVKLTGRTAEGDYNSLAHFVILDGDETGRMMEYAFSPDFVYGAEELDGGYCSDKKIKRGDAVNVNKVMNFLSFPGRAKVFQRMVKSALVCKRNGGKIVISDKPENIMMWIGAIMYALPKKAADALTFNTYTADPLNCDADICGVFARGTSYSPEKIKYPNVLFDMYNEAAPSDEPADEYCSFISSSMSHDYKSVIRFNEFTEKYFDFKEPSYDIDVAYGIYSVLNGGVKETVSDTFKVCLLLLEHSSPSLAISVSEKLVSDADMLGMAEPTVLLQCLEAVCMPYKYASFEHKKAIRETVANCILVFTVGKYANGKDVSELYSKLSNITDKAGFSLADGLMSAENRKKLTAILMYKPAQWKVDFAVYVLVDYADKHGIASSDLDADSPIGAFVSDIVSSGEKEGIQLYGAIKVTEPFADSASLLCGAYSRAFSALSALSDGEKNTEEYRKYFAELASGSQLENRTVLFDYFLKAEDFKTLYAVYSDMMKNRDGESVATLYTDHYRECLAVNADYCAEYLVRATEDYYAASKTHENIDEEQCELEIFEVISAKKMVVPSSQACIDGICSRIALSPPDEDEREIIRKMHLYMLNVRGVVPFGRLAALTFAIECEKIDNGAEYEKTKETLQLLTSKEKIALSDYSEEEWNGYFEWVLPIFTELMLEPSEVEFVLDRFILSQEQQTEFFSRFAKAFLRFCKEQESYTLFCSFLTVLFDRGSDSDKEEVASLIKKLNAKRMEMLSLSAEKEFANKPECQDAFSELVAMPVKKTGFLNGLFKKK